MAPAAAKTAYALIVDVSTHMNETLSNGMSAFHMAKECLVSFIERKIFAESKDEVALILFGSENTENELWEPEDENSTFYKYISVHRAFGAFNWELAQTVESLRRGLEPGDFVEALIVAADHIAKASQGRKTKFASTTLLVFSNLAGGTKCKDQLGSITSSFAEQGIDLRFIGLDDHDNNDNNDSGNGNSMDQSGRSQNGDAGASDGRHNFRRKVKEPQRLEAERLARKMLKRLDGDAYTFIEADSTLRMMQTKKVNPTPFKVALEVGPGLSIPVLAYLKIKQAKPVSWKMTNIAKVITDGAGPSGARPSEDEPSTSTQNQTADSSVVKKWQEFRKTDGDEEKVIDSNDLIKAYRYGSSLVQVNEVLADSMKLKNNEKSMKIVAFSPAEQVGLHLMLGDGCHVIVADPSGGEATALRFSAMVQAMAELKRVAIVRKVHNKVSSPKVGCLYPEVGDGIRPDALYYVELAFTEETSIYTFARLPTGDVMKSISDDKTKKDREKAKLAAHCPSEEGLEAIDALIDAAMLHTDEGSDEFESGELFRPEDTRDPYIQHFYRCVRERILHQDLNEALPAASTTDHLHLPEGLRAQRTAALDHVAEQFTLVDRKYYQEEPSTSNADTNNDGDGNVDQSALDALIGFGTATNAVDPGAPRTRAATNVTWTTPVEDFQDLVRNETVPFDEAAEMLIAVMYTQLGTSLGSSEYLKCQRCLEVFRHHCIQKRRPGIYNDALRDLFKRLQKNADFFAKAVQNNLGLITVDECRDASGTVSVQEASDFADAVGAKGFARTSNGATDSNGNGNGPSTTNPPTGHAAQNARDLLADL